MANTFMHIINEFPSLINIIIINLFLHFYCSSTYLQGCDHELIQRTIRRRLRSTVRRLIQKLSHNCPQFRIRENDHIIIIIIIINVKRIIV